MPQKSNTFLSRTLKPFTALSAAPEINPIESKLRTYLASKLPAELSFMVNDIAKYVVTLLPSKSPGQRIDTFIARTLAHYLNRSGLNDEGLFKKIVGDVPEMKFDIILPADTKRSLYIVSGMLGGGMILNGVLNYFSK